MGNLTFQCAKNSPGWNKTRNVKGMPLILQGGRTGWGSKASQFKGNGEGRGAGVHRSRTEAVKKKTRIAFGEGKRRHVKGQGWLERL